MSNPESAETASDLLVSASAHVVGVLAEALAQHAAVAFGLAVPYRAVDQRCNCSGCAGPKHRSTHD